MEGGLDVVSPGGEEGRLGPVAGMEVPAPAVQIVHDLGHLGSGNIRPKLTIPHLIGYITSITSTSILVTSATLLTSLLLFLPTPCSRTQMG